MVNLLAYADEYVKQSSWKDFALVKICLCAMGVMIGIATPKKARKTLVIVAVIMFIATYIPLILKFLRIVRENKFE